MSEDAMSENELAILMGRTEPAAASDSPPAVEPAPSATPPEAPAVSTGSQPAPGAAAAAPPAPAAAGKPEDDAASNLRAALQAERIARKEREQELAELRAQVYRQPRPDPAGGPPEPAPPDFLVDPLAAIQHRFQGLEDRLQAERAQLETERIRNVAAMEDYLGQQEFGADYEKSLEHVRDHFARAAELQLRLAYPSAPEDEVRAQALRNSAAYLAQFVRQAAATGAERPRHAVMKLAEVVGFQRGQKPAPAGPDPVARAQELARAQEAAKSLAQPGGQKPAAPSPGPSVADLLADDFADRAEIEKALRARTKR